MAMRNRVKATMDRRKIVMNFTFPPSAEDIEVIAQQAIDNLPEELIDFTENMALQIEEIADEGIQEEMELDDPYELIALYRSGKQIAPGVERKVANDDDVLILFRRPLLDLWNETGEDINILVRQVLIEELGQNFDFTEREINEMANRHHQGML